MQVVRWVSPVLILAVAFAPSGCGSGLPKTYPAQGVVEYKGTAGAAKPLVGGFVRLESVADSKTYARGEVQEDGTFSLVMYKDGRSFGGLVPGEYRARVEPPGFDTDDTEDARARNKKLRTVQPQYMDFEKSGLKFQIEPRDNDLKIEVEK